MLRALVLVAVFGTAVLGAAVSSVPASSAGDARGPSSAANAVTTVLVTSVGVIESELTQLADGRAKLRTTLGGLSGCTVSPSLAATRLVEVVANRTGIAGQLATLPAPTAEAVRVKALLRSALDHSLAADRHYRDWVVSLESLPRCSTTANGDLAAAQHEDVRATAAKKSFVAAFNPLARRLHLRTWTAADI